MNLRQLCFLVAISLGLLLQASAGLSAQTEDAHYATPDTYDRTEALARSARPLVQTVVEQLDHLQASMRAAREQHNWLAYLAGAKRQRQLLNGSPASRLEVARAEIHVGNERAALAELAAYAKMGQASDLIETLPEFNSLSTASALSAIRSRVLRNRSPTTHSSVAFKLSDSRLLPEDIDYDASNKRFMITSVLQHKIVSVDGAGNSIDFAVAPDAWPMLALKIDTQRKLLWTTEVALKGFDVVDKADQGRSVILCYDLKSAKLLRRVEGPRPSALGDIALTEEGDLIASDGESGGIYRLRGDRLERLDGGDFVSPQTAAMASDGTHIFVPDYTRGVGILDTRTRQVRWLPMSGRFALNGIDGLYRVGRGFIAVQNGTTPERVIRFSIEESSPRVISESTMERATPTLGIPTHGVMVHDVFYYIANSGWDALDAKGNVEAAKTMTAASIMRVDIRSTRRRTDH